MKGFGYSVAFLAGAAYVWVMENVEPKTTALIIILLIWFVSMTIYRYIMSKTE